MTIAATMTETEAMQPVHWNLIAIPVGTWIAADYFGKTEIRAAR